MGDFTKRIYERKKIPAPDLIKLQVMFVKLPPVSLKSVKGGKLIPVDHYKNLVELYHSGGLSACSEYYQNMTEKYHASVKAKITVAHKNPVRTGWRERWWMKIMNLIGRR